MKNKEWLISVLKDKEMFFESSPKGSYEDGLCQGFFESWLLVRKLEEPEQGKPVIPQFVADYLEKLKGWNDDANCYEEDNSMSLLSALDLDSAGIDRKIEEYLIENSETFAKAWLDGYSVEKEKRYYVYDKATKSYLGYNAVRTQLNWWTSRLENESFTEQEIKAIDERYWTFAEEVTK